MRQRCNAADYSDYCPEAPGILAINEHDGESEAVRIWRSFYGQVTRYMQNAVLHQNDSQINSTTHQKR